MDDPAKCTILITDKVRRTYKFLCALAKGVPIVSIDWLRDCEIAKRFLDWKNYILNDPAGEAMYGFRLRKSLDKANEKKMLDGYVVVLTTSVAPLSIEELKGNANFFFISIYKICLAYLYFYRYSVVLWRNSSVKPTNQEVA